MAFDFSKLNETLEQSKKDIVEDRDAVIYLTSILHFNIHLTEIDFDAFDLDDINEAHSSLTGGITDEDMSGNVCYSPTSPMGCLMQQVWLVQEFNKTPVQKTNRPYQFI